MKVSELRKKIEEKKVKSQWGRAKKEYALELLEDFSEEEEVFYSEEFKKRLLNGAENWQQYSEGGCSLVYNYDIALRLATPSEFKKKKEGLLNPNSNENWIDCQARILQQSSWLINNILKNN